MKNGFDRFTHALSVVAATFAGVLLLLMVGHTVLEMTLRTFFDRSTYVLDEFVGYAVAALTMLGLGYALNTGGILRVNLMTRKLPAGVLRWLELANVLMVLALMGVLIRFQYAAVATAFRRGTLSGTLSNTPTWIPMAVFLAGITLFALQLVAYAIRLVRTGEIIESTSEEI